MHSFLLNCYIFVSSLRELLGHFLSPFLIVYRSLYNWFIGTNWNLTDFPLLLNKLLHYIISMFVKNIHEQKLQVKCVGPGRYPGLGGDTEYSRLRNIKSLRQCWTQRDNFLFLVAQNQCIASRLYIDSLIIKDTEYTWPWNSTRMEQNKSFIQHQQGKHALNPACSSQLHEIFLNLVTITLSYLFAFCLLFFSSLALMLPAHVFSSVTKLCHDTPLLAFLTHLA